MKTLAAVLRYDYRSNLPFRNGGNLSGIRRLSHCSTCGDYRCGLVFALGLSALSTKEKAHLLSGLLCVRVDSPNFFKPECFKKHPSTAYLSK